MNEMVITQLYLLLIYTLGGLIIGVLFDTFRILRKSFNTSDLITYFEDIIFWILTSIFLMFLLFKFNNGQIRSYTFFGIIQGIIIYILFISKYFIRINTKILIIIKNIFKPFSFIVININKFFDKIFKKNIKLYHKKKDFE